MQQGNGKPHADHTSDANTGGVVITGASTGIGFHSACDLVQRGFRVFGTVRREEDGTALREAGVVPILMDVTDAESISRGRDQIAEQLGDLPLRGLVNNAGITLPGPLELLEVDEYRQVFEVNLFGVVAVTKAFLPLLKQSKGRVINVSSISVNLHPPFNSPYVTSKSALEALTYCLRCEFHPFGIEVLILQPGNVNTEIWRKGAQRDLSRAENTVYAPFLTSMRDYAKNVRAMPPSRTSDAIAKLLTAPRPPVLLAVVGRRLRHQLTRWIPQRIKHRIITKRVWGHLSEQETSS